MTNTLTTERSKIKASIIREIFNEIPKLAAERKTAGLPDLIVLAPGEPKEPNREVLQQLTQMSGHEFSTGYSHSQGEPATLEAIVRFNAYRYPKVKYKTSEVMVTMGGTGALSNIFSILLEKKEDIVLTFEPFFANYTGQVEEWGGTFKAIPTAYNHFRPTALGLKNALQQNPQTKAVLLNYPNNPSGICLTAAEVADLAQVLREYPHVLIILDDVYGELNYTKPESLLDYPDFKDRCVVINSGSKTLLAAPGLRIGMLSAPAELIQAMCARQTNGILSVPYYTQAALRFAVNALLDTPQNTWLHFIRKTYKTHLEIAMQAFKEAGFEISVIPEGGFYLFINASCLLNIHGAKNDVDIMRNLIKYPGVVTIPGSGFGCDPSKGYLRICCVSEPQQLTEAARRMGEYARSFAIQPHAKL